MLLLGEQVCSKALHATEAVIQSLLHNHAAKLIQTTTGLCKRQVALGMAVKLGM